MMGYISIFLYLVVCIWIASVRAMSPEEMLESREKARHMFQHAYDSYMTHGYPYDEVKPRSCKGFNTWGNFSLTLVDSLDTLIIMGNSSEFKEAYDRLLDVLNFDVDFVTSVFESNIRVLGGLLSAHLLLHRTTVELHPAWPCKGRLLDLAVDLADRLLPAFDTPTKMPYGSINLRHGVPPGETTVTCAAGVGTFVIEFGVLSRLTGDMRYESAALAAMQALHDAREKTGLIQSHVDISTGQFTVRESSIGSGMDSYFEYMLKGGILLHNRNLLDMFNEHYRSIRQYLLRTDWYIIGEAETGNGVQAIYQSLDSFFPGLQTLMGDVRAASRTAVNYASVWRRYGAVPEMYDIVNNIPRATHPQYPLRPELIESIMYLYRSTGDPFWLHTGRSMLESIEAVSKCPCGYGTILDVSTHELEDRMHSYFLSETVKYLYLLFDTDNFIFNDLDVNSTHRAPSWTHLSPGCQIGVGGYIFSTEAHPFNLGSIGCCHAARKQAGEQQDEKDNRNSSCNSASAGSYSNCESPDWEYGASKLAGDFERKKGRTGKSARPSPADGKPVVAEAAKRILKTLGLATTSPDGSGQATAGLGEQAHTTTHDLAGLLQEAVDLLREKLEMKKQSNAQVSGLALHAPTGDQAADLDKNLLHLDTTAASQWSAMLAALGKSSEDVDIVSMDPSVTGDLLDIHQRLANIERGLMQPRDLSDDKSTIDAATAFLKTVKPSRGDDELEGSTTTSSLSVDELLVYADETLSNAKAVSNKLYSDAEDASTLSRKYLSEESRFESEFYLSSRYTTKSPGLEERLEVYGGTVDL